ncbi:site-specific DNA-methyltransferase [Psychrobacter aquimaris]|uniref:site-specific DNA-methyltransferase n=1 Tax=Psychrobacter aquimaris TaxID=292733 RepID=UPI003FCF98C8
MPLLNWVNRNQAEETADNVPYHLLKLEEAYGDKQKAKDNLIIQGDNLQALKALLPLYGGQVKCIFIDPPYNTEQAFEHYDDKLEHAQWLSLMYPRLQLLKNLLSIDGSIWITVDDKEAHYLKVLCDEVFGRQNFVANVVWQKRTSPDNRLRLGAAHDHILVYATNSKAHQKFNQLEVRESRKKDFKNLDDDPRGAWASTDFTGMTGHATPSQFYTITAPSGKQHTPPKGRCWAISEENFKKLVEDNRVWFGSNGTARPRLKRYLSEMKGQNAWTWWTNKEVGHNQESKKEINNIFESDNPFDTPKPERLIQRILQLSTGENDIVLDSFLGSGTTAAVAHKMGRRYIGIEMGDHAKTHVIPRLEKVIDGEQGGISTNAEWQGGGGFSFYTLGSAVFDEQGFLHSEVKFSDLASYVWWLETHTAFISTNDITTPFLGVHEGVAYYLLYNGILGDRRPNGGNVLTNPILKYLNECHQHEGKRIIIGEATRIGSAKLETLDIEFKQIPYALYGSHAK